MGEVIRTDRGGRFYGQERLARQVIFELFVTDPNVKEMQAMQRLGRRVFLAEGTAQCKGPKMEPGWCVPETKTS